MNKNYRKERDTFHPTQWVWASWPHSVHVGVSMYYTSNFTWERPCLAPNHVGEYFFPIYPPLLLPMLSLWQLCFQLSCEVLFIYNCSRSCQLLVLYLFLYEIVLFLFNDINMINFVNKKVFFFKKNKKYVNRFIFDNIKAFDIKLK